MKLFDSVERNVSKLAFLFLAYTVITGGYVSKILSCQLQKTLETNIYLKHVVGFILIFVFIMLEGGWDFDQNENDKAPVDWSKGNSLHTMVYAIFMYSAFVMTSKMQVIPNLVFLGLLLCIYVINTQRLYWTNRQAISGLTEDMMKQGEIILIGGTTATFIYGLIDYYMYQKRQYGSSFRIQTFVLGTNTCKYL
jgi:hypothetical protein